MCIFLLLTTVSCKTQTIVYGEPELSETAIIFYPGGKVDPNAYSELCTMLSDQGIPVIVAKMPMNLAILNRNAASDIIEEYPSVENWFLGGHSLGGVMASSWAQKHRDSVSGIILLASYPTSEISIPTLSIYGSEDGVLNMKKYKKGMLRISDLQEYVIVGGNHSQFGSYGSQKGDNEASISREEQIGTTVSQILDFVHSH